MMLNLNIIKTMNSMVNEHDGHWCISECIQVTKERHLLSALYIRTWSIQTNVLNNQVCQYKQIKKKTEEFVAITIIFNLRIEVKYFTKHKFLSVYSCDASITSSNSSQIGSRMTLIEQAPDSKEDELKAKTCSSFIPAVLENQVFLKLKFLLKYQSWEHIAK